MRKFLFVLLLIAICSSQAFAAEHVLIYSCAEDYRNEFFTKRLKEEFPAYDVTIEYIPSGHLAAKLAAEGLKTDIDIIFDLDCGYAEMIEPYLANLSSYDQSIYVDDCKVKSARYLISERNGGAIILNPAVLKAKGIDEPKSYSDLLKSEFKNLISMPNPKSSGTGYMFVKNLVNVWGEEKAFDYFGNLAGNVLQFTSSGLGPVNSLVQGETAVGFGPIAQAVTAINSGTNLKIEIFEEGSPYSLFGYAIVEGKQTRKAVRDVFDFFYATLVLEDKELYYPEQIFVNQVNKVENYPTNIPYADMRDNTMEEKLRLLENWEY